MMRMKARIRQRISVLLRFGVVAYLSVVVKVVPCSGQLVGPGAVTTFSGGGGRSRGGFATVRDPAAGFFIAGSSLKGMNGIYRRVPEEGVEDRRDVTLAYKNKFTGWILAMIEPPESSPYELVGSKRSEWLLLDEEYNDRFGHEGRTFVPGSGTRWSHLHRAPPFGPSSTTSEDKDLRSSDISLPDEKKKDADDMDELPWQLVYIGDPSMVARLESQYASYAYIVRQALDHNKVYESGAFKRISAAPESENSQETKGTGKDAPAEVEVALWSEDMKETCLEFYSEQIKDQGSTRHRAAVLVQKSICHHNERDWAGSVLLLTQVLNEFPHNTRALELRGLSFLDLGDPQSALDDFERILSLDRDYQNLKELLIRASADHVRKTKSLKQRDDNAHLIGESSASTSGRDDVQQYNHYLWLELPFNFKQSELKKAYRKLSKLYHPDVGQGSAFAFERLAAAHDVLSNSEARNAYDEGSDLNMVNEEPTFKEKVFRKYFPDLFGFEPFGDPLENRRRQESRERARNRPKPKPNDPNIPQGTYLKSCKGCHLANNDTMLVCTHCLGVRAAVHNSSLDLGTCAEDEIVGNMNGQLVCEREKEEEPLPKGTYGETCKKCHFARDGVLQCHCHTGYQRTALALASCGPGAVVANQHGTLACANPPNESAEDTIEETTRQSPSKTEL